MPKDPLKTIIDACIKAHPSNFQTDIEKISRTIGICDVLLAVPDNYVEARLSKPYVLIINHHNRTDAFWNLLQDDIILQTKETQEFIANLLQP